MYVNNVNNNQELLLESWSISEVPIDNDNL